MMKKIRGFSLILCACSVLAGCNKSAVDVKDYSVGDIKNIIWCLVKRLRKKLNAIEDGAGNCIVSVRDIGYKFELNKENEQQ